MKKPLLPGVGLVLLTFFCMAPGWFSPPPSSGGSGSTNNVTLTGSTVLRTNALVDRSGSGAIGGTNIFEVQTVSNAKALEVGTNNVVKIGGTLWASGSVIQTVWAQKTDTLVNNVSSTWTNILTAAITPKLLGSRLIVNSVLNVHPSGTYGLIARIATNDVSIIAPDSPGSRLAGDAYVYGQAVAYVTEQMSFLSSHIPNSTSTVTYQLQALVESGGTMWINRSQSDTDNASHPRTITTMMIQEIAP